MLCEAKFYAGLTSNQPNTYIDRLKNNNGIGLVFICPAVRKETLWSHLLDLTKHRKVKFIDDFCAEIDGISLSILTWNVIIEVLHQKASESEPAVLSDINQLRGFCQQMDRDAFIPFSSEDLGTQTPRLEERYYQVLDNIIDRLMSMKSLNPSLKGLKATAYRQGYVRYVKINNYALSIYYDRALWKHNGTVETPFWLAINMINQNGNWYQPPSFYRVFNRYKSSEREENYGKICLPLYPAVNVSLDDVVANISEQILAYIDEFNNVKTE